MAKAKEAASEKKLTPEQQSKAILSYLHAHNRPYSAIEISGNCKISKTLAVKLLKEMHERKEIDGKAAGKQNVYFPVQPETDDSLTEKLTSWSAETTRLREATIALKDEEKQHRQSLRSGATIVPLHELQSAVTSLQIKKAELEARLVRLRSDTVEPVKAEERDQVTKVLKQYEKIARNRKKIRKALWEEILDRVPEEQVVHTRQKLGLEF